MKNLVVTLSLAAAVVCGLLLVRKNHEAVEARLRAVAAEAEREAIATAAEQEQRRNQALQSQLNESMDAASLHAAEARKLELQLSNSRNGRGEKEHKRPADDFFRDPEVREAFIAEAREGVGKNVKSLFQLGLAQELQLDDQQAAQLRTLLMERSSLLSERILVPMMLGDLSDAEMAASGRATRQLYDENTARLKALLGDERFGAYERFEKTESDRDHVRRFAAQLSEAGGPLGAEQQSQLLSGTIDERLNFKFQHEIGDLSQWDFEHWYDNVTEGRLIAFGNEMEQLNERLVQRAQTVLTPDQAAQWKSFLAEQLRRAKFVTRTTTAMFSKRP